MHVLPLPFGLALALMPRRDIELIRICKIVVPVKEAYDRRDRFPDDVRYFRV